MKNVNIVASHLASLLVSAAVGFLLGYFCAVFYSVPPATSGEWATWAGAVGTITAVLVAGFAIYAQNRRELSLERLRRDQDEAASLLALCYLGSEIRRMCTLSGYQIDAPGNTILYPNISEDFGSMATMISQLPIERVAARSLVGHSLAMRRIALQMSELYKCNPQQGDGFYLRNRKQLRELEGKSYKLSADIAVELKQFAPELFGLHEAELSRL